jgi:hypothetical protein
VEKDHFLRGLYGFWANFIISVLQGAEVVSEELLLNRDHLKREGSAKY